nr:MAG TPA: hypothetical protein [Caudoviricetes sp.]
MHSTHLSSIASFLNLSYTLDTGTAMPSNYERRI